MTADEKSEALNECSAAIKTCGKGEIAKFITGDRSPDEYVAFAAELEGMGLRDWERICQIYSANYLANMG